MTSDQPSQRRRRTDSELLGTTLDGIHDKLDVLTRALEVQNSTILSLNIEIHKIRIDLDATTRKFNDTPFLTDIEIHRILDPLRGNIHGIDLKIQELTIKYDHICTEYQRLEKEQAEYDTENQGYQQACANVGSSLKQFENDLLSTKKDVEKISQTVEQIRSTVTTGKISAIVLFKAAGILGAVVAFIILLVEFLSKFIPS